MTINSIRGFRDIAPPDIFIWEAVEKEAIKLFKSFSFKPIYLPIIENTELFTRSIGDVTDIVEKEMYTFPDVRKGSLSLRPEATASVVRFYIQKKLFASDPIQKLYTIGPMFRRERPQKGRFRQFYQINAEVFGIESPYMDALLIFILNKFFKRVGIENLKTKINSLGCANCRPKFNKTLFDYIKNQRDNLCGDCKKRVEQNPLRVLDCKNEDCRKIVSKVPSIIDFLCEECKIHYEEFKNNLIDQKIEFIEDKNLVRGLDYYTKTIFEIQTEELGAQNSIAGGGRYDALIEMLGGKKTPAIGFAIGLDRVCEIISTLQKVDEAIDVYIIALDRESRKKGYDFFLQLGSKNIKVDIDFEEKSLKSFMKKANKLNAKNVIIIGEEELKEKKVILRDMNSKEQLKIDFDEVAYKVEQEICKKK